MLLVRFQRVWHGYTELFWAIYDSRTQYSKTENVLFVDCGANLGQGYHWLSKFFKQSNVEFEMFEPNFNCYSFLEEIPAVKSGKVKLNKGGIGTDDSLVNLYGLDDPERGPLSQGGSTNIAHNSKFYSSSEAKSIEVKVFNFSEYLQGKSALYDKILVKMDIEGAEVEVLESLIADKSINYINVLYVEFHSQFQDLEESKVTKNREDRIIDKIKNETNTLLRIWH
ncbi:FkbM family methyltransferase [bacterium]|nr:FkbM family methyltransferase [bacterium]